MNSRDKGNVMMFKLFPSCPSILAVIVSHTTHAILFTQQLSVFLNFEKNQGFFPLHLTRYDVAVDQSWLGMPCLDSISYSRKIADSLAKNKPKLVKKREFPISEKSIFPTENS